MMKPGRRFLSETFFGKTSLHVGPSREIFCQGDPASSVFYLRKGTIKLASRADSGKQAIVAMLHAGEFFGEGCLLGHAWRRETATALADCEIEKIEKPAMERMIRENPAIREGFLDYLLSRTLRYEQELIDQLFNNSERRLGRILLRLANLGRKQRAPIVPKINQENLAQMIGTTRSRVSYFMNQFRREGLVDYNRRGSLFVTSRLREVFGPPFGPMSLASGRHNDVRPNLYADVT